MIDMSEDYTVASVAFMKAGDKCSSFYDKDRIYYPSSNTIEFAISQSMT